MDDDNDYDDDDDDERQIHNSAKTSSLVLFFNVWLEQWRIYKLSNMYKVEILLQVLHRFTPLKIALGLTL